MNKNQFAIGYFIFTLIALGMSFINNYDWMFIPWFAVTCLLGIGSWIVQDIQRDNRLRELEEKLNANHDIHEKERKKC